MTYRFVVAAAMAVLLAPAAHADGIAPGLWTIIDRIENGGVTSPIYPRNA